MRPKDVYDQAVKKGKRLKSYENVVAQDADYSLLYAKNVCKGPFVMGESSISNHPFNAYLYCKDVIKQRWYSAEDAIKKDCRSSCCYARDVIKGRWHDAERNIVKSPEWAATYAEEVMKSRFIEAETTISKKEAAAVNYYHFVIRGNWDGWTQRQIMKSEVWMYYLAKGIGHTLPKELHDQMMLRNPRNEYVARYIKEFCR